MTRYAVFILMHVIYNALWAAATPLGRLYFACSKRNAALRARLAPVTPVFATAPIWIHACSVGEVAAARTLALALKRDLPEQALLFTTSTSTGHAQAERQLAPLGGLAWCPFDAPGAVRSFLRAAKPRMLVLIETEIWPNLLREAERAGIPVLLVNGRISERHFERYKKVSSLFHRHSRGSRLPPCRTRATRNASRRLARVADHVCITGNLKFDAVATNVDASTCSARLRAQHGIPARCPRARALRQYTSRGRSPIAASCWASSARTSSRPAAPGDCPAAP
jgi:3-deoxy-D-manno-octulosonic-acid transferase